MIFRAIGQMWFRGYRAAYFNLPDAQKENFAGSTSGWGLIVKRAWESGLASGKEDKEVGLKPII